MTNPQYAYPNAAQGTFVTVGDKPKYAHPYPAQGTFVTVGDEPKYAHPYPAQGYHQAPLVMVMAPPAQYAAPAAPPPGRERGFLEGCHYGLRCCCLINECCSDPSTPFIG